MKLSILLPFSHTIGSLSDIEVNLGALKMALLALEGTNRKVGFLSAASNIQSHRALTAAQSR